MNKNLPGLIAAAALGIFTILASGCYDDPFYQGVSDKSISFNVKVVGTQRDLTRGSMGPRMFEAPVRMVSQRGDSLFLHPSVTEFDAPGMPTRSNQIGSADEMYSEFSVSAYQYDDTWDDTHLAENPNYFDGEQAQKQGSLYVMTPPRYWPNGGKMRFLAHAPVDDDAFTYYAHDDAERGPRVHVRISEDVTQQQDLLISYTSEMTSSEQNSSAPLNFKHALTGVRFVCDKRMPTGVITNITIKGVRYEGDLFYNMTDASQGSTSDLDITGNYNAWEQYDRVFSLPLNYKVTGADSDPITDGETTFMMLPQSLPESATVTITLQHTNSDGTPTGVTETITGSLSGREWPAGKIVTYKISTSDQILEVEQPSIYNYLGKVYNSTTDTFIANNPIKVASSSGTKNMKWKVEYMDDAATAWSATSSWLSIDPTWSWSDEAEQEVPFVAKSTYNSIDIDANLKKAASVGSSASPYNLANSTGGSGVQNTANSYIVSAPGYYMLPLVYGNAIKGSATNASAYNYSGSGANILSKFVNHLGAAITAPYIADNAGCVPDHASIVWQDAQNLVQNVEYVSTAYGGKGGIRFYVSPANIKQGNAVISISDKNNVMWSWHIWATTFEGFDSTLDVTNADGQTFSVMPMDLGWCSNGEMVRYYPKRTCKVRFTPTEGDTSLSEVVTFVQESHTSVPFGNEPYYQWGRKDPFVGTNIAWGNKERWDGTGKYYGTGSENNPPRLFSDLVEDTSSDRLTTKECLDLLIKNPDKWHNPPAVKGGTSYISKNDTYRNLWGDNTLTDTKTVYDPCPPGYQVNYYYTYTGFLASGYDWTSDKGINFVDEVASDWDTTNLAEFYCDSGKMHSIIFPVSGYRDWNDKAEVVDFKLRGFVWMRGTEDGLQSYMFRYAAHSAGVANVAPVTMFYSTDGLPVRPGVAR